MMRSMMMFTAMWLVAVMGGTAQARPPVPTMTFVSVPAAVPSGAALPELEQFRRADAMIVILRQPAPCGQRPAQPWFDARHGVLQVGYSLPADAGAARTGACVAAGIFSFKGLPEGQVQVAARTSWLAQAAQQDAAAPVPAIGFLAIPAAPRSVAGEPGTAESDTGSGRVVVAKVPARCGERPSSPSFDLAEGALRIGYDVAAPDAADPQPCVATAIFTLKNPPRRDLRIVADARPVRAAPLASKPGAPSMTFLSVPAVAQGELAQPERLEYRSGDHLVVILKEPSACGERPAAPWFDVVHGSVRVGYDVANADAQADESSCLATGIFTLSNLPEAAVGVASE